MNQPYEGYRVFYPNAQKNFDYYVKYGAVCAASGVAEENIGALREYAVQMAVFWGLDPTRANLPKFYKAFDDAVARAKETGQAKALTISEKILMLKGLSYYAYHLHMQGVENGINKAKYLAARLLHEWTRTRKDSEALYAVLPKNDEMVYVLFTGIGHKYLDALYFQCHDKIAECIQLLPEYAAYLLSEGRKAEAVRVEALGYDMVCAWYDNQDILDTIESPDTYLDRIAALNPEQSRVLDQSEMQIIYDGIRTNGSIMEIKSVDKARQVREMGKRIAIQIGSMLEKAGSAEPKAVQCDPDKTSRIKQKAKVRKRNPER